MSIQPGIMQATLRLNAIVDRLLNGSTPDQAISKFNQIAREDHGIRYVALLEFLRQRERINMAEKELRAGQINVDQHTVHTTSAGTQPHSRTRESPAEHRLPETAHVDVSDSRSTNRTFVPGSRQNPPRGIEAIARMPKLLRVTMESFKVRDGRSIGKLKWHELVKLAETNEKEARVLRYIANHVANAPSHADVCDIVSEDFLNEAVKEAGITDER